MHLPRFSATPELSRLVRHLRLLGFDSTWSEDRSQEEVLEEVRSEGRILLTRDEGLCHRASGATSYRVLQDGRDEELVEVLDRFGLREPVRAGKGYFSLCLQCNAPL